MQVSPGFDVSVMVENLTGTDGSVSHTSQIFTPLNSNGLHDESGARMLPTSGNLLNIAIDVDIPGIELHIDESWNNLLTWRRADQVLLTPGLPTFERAFRWIGHFAKVTLYNGGGSLATIGLLVRTSTM